MLDQIIIVVYKNKTVVFEYYNNDKFSQHYEIYDMPNPKKVVSELNDYIRKNCIILSAKNIKLTVCDESFKLLP